MYPRFQTTRTAPPADLAAQVEEMLDLISGHPGFAGAWMLPPIAAGAGGLLTLWQTQDDAEQASERTAAIRGSRPVDLPSARTFRSGGRGPMSRWGRRGPACSTFAREVCMVDAGISPEQAENVVTTCGLVIAALARLGPQCWMPIELAIAVEAERRPMALTEARTKAKRDGCAAMLDYTLQTCRRLVRSAEGLQDCPDLDALVAAVEGSVAAALMTGRIDRELAAVLTAPQRALASLLATATTASVATPTATPTATVPGLTVAREPSTSPEVRHPAVPSPRRRPSAVVPAG